MKNFQKIYAILFIILIALPVTLQSKVLRVEIESRETILNGQQFGEYGAYQLLQGKIYFGFDPANAMNASIVDLQLAPRNQAGLVEAWANFVVLQPKEVSKARGVALVEVSNRGGKFSLRYYNRSMSRELEINNPESFGNNLIMRQGLTVIWVGWQYDVPDSEGALRLHVPRAKNLDGSPIFGLVRSDWTIDETVKSLQISHRNHLPYPVVAPKDEVNILTVREGRDAPRRIVPREQWRFAREENGEITPNDTFIYIPSGFEAGKIYELVHRAKNPAVVGLGFAAIRDVISYAKYDDASVFTARHGLAAGVSQTGRFLRHFLYQGFNTDEAGRQAYDGMMIITAGAGRGSFNHRFAQPSRDAHRYSAFFYPTDIFPFTSRTQHDPEQWRSDGLLTHLHNPEHAPKTFYLNTGYEYWGRAASLIHTSVDGTTDVEPLANERIYHLASGQHFVGRFPPQRLADTNVYRGNPLDFSVNYRALLVKLVEWVDQNIEPPASAYPRIDNGSLVKIEAVDFPQIAGVTFPKTIHLAYRADYGSRWFQGTVDQQPPKLGRTFLSLVSQVDANGNEIAGIRNVEIRVPLATYTPWNLRTGFAGGQNELTDFRGTLIPFPQTIKIKRQSNDPRPEIASLYTSRDNYLKRVHAATTDLVREGFLLVEDQEYVTTRAAGYWDWIFEGANE